MRQSDTRMMREALARTAAALDTARKCPVYKGAHMLNIQQHEGIKFQSTRPLSCKEFMKLSPQRKAGILKEYNICLLCTSFTQRKQKCYLKE